MPSQTRENMERAAYAAVGAPVAAIKALSARVSDLREMLESSRKEINQDLAKEFNEWIAQGEDVLESAMDRIRSTGMVDELRRAVDSTRRSAEVGVRKASRAMEESFEFVVPDTGIERINGVGPNYAQQLNDVGVAGVADFLSATGTQEDIAKLAELSGFSAGTISSWRDQVDLSRVDGIGGAYQRSLHRVDIWTLRELSKANPERLTERLASIEMPDAPDQLPSIYQVTQWVDEAKSLINRK